MTIKHGKCYSFGNYIKYFNFLYDLMIFYLGIKTNNCKNNLVLRNKILLLYGTHQDY